MIMLLKGPKCKMLNTYVNFASFLALHVQPFCETFVSVCISHFKAAVSILHDFFFSRNSEHEGLSSLFMSLN